MCGFNNSSLNSFHNNLYTQRACYDIIIVSNAAFKPVNHGFGCVEVDEVIVYPIYPNIV